MEKTKASPPTLAFEKLLYRCQFILGPFFIDELNSWKRVKINHSLYLTVHPDLEITQTVSQGKSITLLGFMLDPDNAQARNSDIIDNLIQSLFSHDDLFEQTGRFGGRWILIVDDGRKVGLFNDATGLRQVFYTDIRYTKDLWCASQPGLIAKVLDLQMDQDAIDFLNSSEVKRNKEYWWPGESSPYKEIKHLLPNHCLNLETGRCFRYWPQRGLEKLTLDQAVEKVSGILRGLLQSASNRFDLAISLTAGWDSRLILASSKEISHKVSYMTVKKLSMSESSADLAIPSKTASKLGLEYDIVQATSHADDQFLKLFRESVTLAHDVWAPDAQAIFDFYHQSKVAVVGGVSEVARCSYSRSKYDKQTLTARKLSTLARMGEHPFAIKFFKDWLSGLGDIYNLNVLDLFQWEQRTGNWLAMCQLEFGMAWQDIFAPYNCRSLLSNMLAVDEKHRRPPKFRLYRELILHLWPEVLREPINPHKKKSLVTRLKGRFRFFKSLLENATTSILTRGKPS